VTDGGLAGRSAVRLPGRGQSASFTAVDRARRRWDASSGRAGRRLRLLPLRAFRALRRSHGGSPQPAPRDHRLAHRRRRSARWPFRSVAIWGQDAGSGWCWPSRSPSHCAHVCDAAAFGAIAEIVGPAQFGRAQGLLVTVWATGMGQRAGRTGQLIEAVGPKPRDRECNARRSGSRRCARSRSPPAQAAGAQLGRHPRRDARGIDVNPATTPVVRRHPGHDGVREPGLLRREALVCPSLRECHRPRLPATNRLGARPRLR